MGALVLIPSGFALLFLSHFVRGLVGAVARRDPWVAWLGTEAGLFNGVVFAGILAADGRAVFAAVGWGLAMWPAAAVVTALCVPRMREANAPA